MKLEVFILGSEEKEGMVEMLGEIRKWRRERFEKGSRGKIERKEKKQMGVEKEEHHYLPQLVVQLPQGTAVLLRKHEFPTRFCSKVLQQ